MLARSPARRRRLTALILVLVVQSLPIVAIVIPLCLLNRAWLGDGLVGAVAIASIAAVGAPGSILLSASHGPLQTPARTLGVCLQVPFMFIAAVMLLTPPFVHGAFLMLTAWVALYAIFGPPDTAPTDDNHCPKCDYSLLGLPQATCPECGWSETAKPR